MMYRGDRLWDQTDDSPGGQIIKQALEDDIDLFTQIDQQEKQALVQILHKMCIKFNLQIQRMNAEITENNQKFNEQLAKLSQHIQQIQTENQALDEMLHQTNQKRCEFEQQLDISKGELFMEKQNLEVQMSMKEKLEKSLKRKKERICQLQQQKQQLSQKVNNQKNKNQILEKQVKTVYEQLLKLNKKYSELEERNSSLSQDVSYKQDKIKQLQVKLYDNEFIASLSSHSKPQNQILIEADKQSSLSNKKKLLNQQQINESMTSRSIEFTLPDQNNDQKSQSLEQIPKKTDRSDQVSDRKINKKSSVLPFTHQKRNSRDSNISKKSSSHKINVLPPKKDTTTAKHPQDPEVKPIFMDRVKYRLKVNQQYQQRYNTIKIDRREEGIKDELIRKLKDKQIELQQIIDEQQQKNIFLKKQIKNIQTKYILSKSFTNAIQEELLQIQSIRKEIEQEKSMKEEYSSYVSNQIHKLKSSFDNISQKFQNVVKTYKHNGKLEEDCSFKSAAADLEDQSQDEEQTQHKKGYFSIQNSHIICDQSIIEDCRHKDKLQKLNRSLQSLQYSPAPQHHNEMLDNIETIEPLVLNNMSELGQIKTQRLMLNQFWQPTDRNNNSITQFQIFFRQQNQNNNLQIVSIGNLVIHSPPTKVLTFQRIFSFEIQNSKTKALTINSNINQLKIYPILKINFGVNFRAECSQFEVQTQQKNKKQIQIMTDNPQKLQMITQTSTIATAESGQQSDMILQQIQQQKNTQKNTIIASQSKQLFQCATQTESLLTENTSSAQLVYDQFTNTSSQLQIQEKAHSLQTISTQTQTMNKKNIISKFQLIHSESKKIDKLQFMHYDTLFSFAVKKQNKKLAHQTCQSITISPTKKILKVNSIPQLTYVQKQKKKATVQMNTQLFTSETGCMTASNLQDCQINTDRVGSEEIGVNTQKYLNLQSWVWNIYARGSDTQFCDFGVGIYQLQTVNQSINTDKIDRKNVEVSCDKKRLVSVQAFNFQYFPVRNKNKQKTHFRHKTLNFQQRILSKKIKNIFLNDNNQFKNSEQQFQTCKFNDSQEQYFTVQSEIDEQTNQKMNTQTDRQISAVRKYIQLTDPCNHNPGSSSQINSGRTRSSSQQLHSHRSQQRESMIKILQQKQEQSKLQSNNKQDYYLSESAVQTPSPLIQKFQNEQDCKVTSFQSNRTQCMTNSYQPEMTNSYQPEQSLSTSRLSNENTNHRDTQVNKFVVDYLQANNSKQTNTQSNQQSTAPFSQAQTETVFNYFHSIKNIKNMALTSIYEQGFKDIGQFKIQQKMYAFICIKQGINQKFVLWQGKVLHFADNKIQFMELPLFKNIKIINPPGSLNLGNSQFSLYDRKLLIRRKGKRHIFRGQMTQGEWQVTKIWTIETE